MNANLYRKLVRLSLLLLCVLAGCSSQTAGGPAASDAEQSKTEVTVEPAATEQAEPVTPAAAEAEPEDADFVRVRDYIPDIGVELRYATENNFTGKIIYDFDEAYLRYGTVKKLLNAQETLKSEGYCLKIWDALRPVAAQYKLFEAYPYDAYVADPSKHYSSHNRGNTVDITMVALDGELVEMPTDFDDFSAKADRDYSDCTAEARKNAELLESVMRECGFKPYSAEWWHFADRNDYDVDPDFYPEK